MNVPIPEPSSLGHGIHLIPAPLPFKSPAWVNTYAIEADGGSSSSTVGRTGSRDGKRFVMGSGDSVWTSRRCTRWSYRISTSITSVCRPDWSASWAAGS